MVRLSNNGPMLIILLLLLVLIANYMFKDSGPDGSYFADIKTPARELEEPLSSRLGMGADSLWAPSSSDSAPKSTKPSWPVKLIVLGYKRSGSSITAALIHSHPDASYYLYEPIWYIEDPDYSGIAASDARVPLTKRIKVHLRKFPLQLEPFLFLKDAFECRLTPEHRNLMPYVFDSKPFRRVGECLEEQQPVESCYKEMNENCLNVKVRMVKTVRLAMFEAVQMMEKDPSLKVIHVVRDPRGTMRSRLDHAKVYEEAKQVYLTSNLSEFDQIVEKELNGTLEPDRLYLAADGIQMVQHCRIVENDLIASQEYTSKHPDRIMTLRYEDLAENPHKITPKLLQFVGLDMTPEVNDSITLLMFGGSSGENLNEVIESTSNKTQAMEAIQKERKYIKRSDPWKSANKWRAQGEFELAQKLQKDCTGVFDVLKFRKFNAKEDMMDLEISPILPSK